MRRYTSKVMLQPYVYRNPIMRHLGRLRRAALRFCVVGLVTNSIASVAVSEEVQSDAHTSANCLRQLDRLIVHIQDVDRGAALDGMSALAERCPSLPQAHHNIGVLAAQQKDWERAIAAFNTAIALAPRTADTVAQLQALHRYRAKTAWRVALDLQETPELPAFKWQDSTHQNTERYAQPTLNDGLRSVLSVDLELYTWWHASSVGDDNAAWLAHYVTGYPANPEYAQRSVDWDSVSRDIRFTAQDAVAVLSWQHQGTKQIRYLLLTLVGERWQIYHEDDL